MATTAGMQIEACDHPARVSRAYYDQLNKREGHYNATVVARPER